MAEQYTPVRYAAGQAAKVHARPATWSGQTLCGQLLHPADTDWQELPGEPITCRRCLRGMQLREQRYG